MKRHYWIFLLICGIAVPAAAQTGPRVFDNFDRAQGVPLYLPPPPVTKFGSKKKRNSRWQVKVADPLVKPTARSGRVLSVTDGLATRESVTSFGGKLVMGSSTHLKGFTTGSPVIDSYVVGSSQKYGIDPLLIYSQMHQESSFKLFARSHKGASGLMQLMPATARRFGVTKIYDPQQNIDAGVRYMRWLLDLFNGDVVLALAGYNAGEGAVLKYGGNVPPYRETREYVRRISARYNAISDGRYVHTARRVNNQLAAKLEKRDARPLTVYEPDPIAIRTADGKMILVNQ